MNYLKLLKEFRSLNCTNEALCSAACHVYIELCDVKQLPCVKYHYNEDLNLIYLSANKKQPSKYKQSKCGSSESNASAASSVEANDKEIYLPFLSFDDINLCSMEKIQMILCKNESLKPNSLILAIVDPNSSILYYKLTNGFLDLDAIQ